MVLVDFIETFSFFFSLQYCDTCFSFIKAIIELRLFCFQLFLKTFFFFFCWVLSGGYTRGRDAD